MPQAATPSPVATLLADLPGNGPTAASETAQAFGIGLEGFAPSYLRSPSTPSSGRTTTLAFVARADIEEAWRGARAERVSELPPGTDQPTLVLDRDPAVGHRLWTRESGVYWLAPDGRRVDCAIEGIGHWRWQRFLIAQVLPFAALLQGLEIFHASAVSLAGEAVLFVGPSGAGKTSLAVRLALSGAGFLADDIVAVERRGDRAIAYPGSAMTPLNPLESEALGAVRERLGKTLWQTDEEVLVEVARETRPRPVGAICFLERRDSGDLELRPVSAMRRLLGACSNMSVQTPERLSNLLQLGALLAESALVLEADIPPEVGPAELASAVEARFLEYRRHRASGP